MPNIRVMHVGLGPIGTAILKQVSSRPGFKVVGGVDLASLELAAALYGQVMVEVVRVSSPEVAEACKILENTYRAVNIALVNDEWTCDKADSSKKVKLPPLTQKFLDALRDATIGNEANKMFGCPAASLAAWQRECEQRGLIEPTAKPNSARSLFSRHRLKLIADNWIACNDRMAWMLA